MQRTEWESDGPESDDYVPVGKHVRRTPANGHSNGHATVLLSGRANGHGDTVLVNGGSNGHRGTHAPRPADSLGETASPSATEEEVEDAVEHAEQDADPPEPVPEPVEDTTPGPPGDVDRVSALWRARYAILASTLLVGVVVYLLAGASAPVYSSSSTVSITAASTPGGSAQDVALASNSLAAQDALLVTSDSVLAAAARQLHISPSKLSTHLSAGTLNSQNLIQITAQGPTGDDALRWVQATTTAFQAYLAQRAQKTSSALHDSITAETEGLTQQIDLLRLVIDNAPEAAPGSAALTDLQSDQNQLTQLVATRATLTANTALAVASQQPVITIVVSGTAPGKVSPRPTLYAAVAALLTLLVACQLAVFVARRKLSAPRWS